MTQSSNLYPLALGDSAAFLGGADVPTSGGSLRAALAARERRTLEMQLADLERERAGSFGHPTNVTNPFCCHAGEDSGDGLVSVSSAGDAIQQFAA